jgi:hypothetical protein
VLVAVVALGLVLLTRSGVGLTGSDEGTKPTAPPPSSASGDECSATFTEKGVPVQPWGCKPMKPNATNTGDDGPH